MHEKAVRTNLALAGAAGSATRICRGYSTDPAVRADVGDRQYGVIVVDGDHSRRASPPTSSGSSRSWLRAPIVVLDDYGDPKWPGVQAAWTTI